MEIFSAVVSVIGGVATFVYGLKLLGEGTEKLVGYKLKKFVAGCVRRPFGGFLAGASVAALTQSSAAVTMVAVGLAETKAITFLQSAPVIMGANVGTTVTAQFVAIFGRGGEYRAAIGAISVAVGVGVCFLGKKSVKTVGELFVGFGLTISGLTALSGRIDTLKRLPFLRIFGGVENPLMLLFTGVVVAAVTQSSSAITGILITFSGNSITAFYKAIFIILGSNVGSCFAVILSSSDKSLPAKKAAVFNLVFNLFGALVFFPVLIALKNVLPAIFPHAATDAGRAMADFHTLFNLAASLLAFPLLKPLAAVTDKLSGGKIYKKKKNRVKNACI